jgi:hypothetical protein
MKNMTNEIAVWLKELCALAEADTAADIIWFKETKDKPFAIIAGWSDGFNPNFKDIMYLSEADPCYAMCVKIAVNPAKGDYQYTDFEMMPMPTAKDGSVEDTMLAIERADNFEELAAWLFTEWERISSEA